MKVPAYVQELMTRSAFDTKYTHPLSEPGYTIRVKKRSPYAQVCTLKEECCRLVRWAVLNHADAKVLECPETTHYCQQSALVLITDPVMNGLERYIPQT